MSEQPINKSDPEYSLPVTREELYNQVWEEPMLSLAKKYGVSSSYLARVCSKLNVPRPERGYWAKLAVGKAPKRPSLPELQATDQNEWSRGDTVPERRRQPQPKRASKAAATKLKYSTHPMITGAKALFLKGRKTDNGYLKPSKRLLVDIVISENSLDEGLMLMNQLASSVEQRGYKFCFAPTHGHYYRANVDERANPKGDKTYCQLWGPGRCTVIFVGSLAIGVTLIELSRPVEMMYLKGDYIPVDSITPSQTKQARYAHTWTTTKYMPSGEFAVQLYSPYPGTEWSKKIPIKTNRKDSNLFSSIVKSLFRFGKEIEQLVDIAEKKAEEERKKWAEQQERWRLEEIERKREKSISDSTNELNSIIAKWAEEKRVKDFLDELEREINRNDNADKPLLFERLEQARRLLSSESALSLLSKWQTPAERLAQ